MLEKKYRFHGHGSLRYLYKNNHTARSRHFLLRYVANKQRVHSRLTIIVGKKVYKSSAKRNRIRRRVYEAVQKFWPELSQGYDIAITVYSAEVFLLPYEHLVAEIKQLLSQIPPSGTSDET